MFQAYYFCSRIPNEKTESLMKNVLVVLACMMLCSLIELNAQRGSTEAQTTIAWKEWSNALAETTGTRGQKTMIYVYTDWCAWCQRMEEEVYANPEIVRLANRYFSPVKFNGETRESFTYRGETFNYIKDGRVSYHQLAAKWLNGRISYPSLVFLDESGQVIQAISGPKNTEQMELVLLYFGENHYKTTPWSSFQRNFRPQAER